MYWHKKIIDYDILVPPITKPFSRFTLKDAENYFNWYTTHIHERVNYLSKVSDLRLNYSTETLADIWEWFINIAEIEKTPKAKMRELRKQLNNQPKDIVKTVLKEQSEQFTLQTEYIIFDIAMYFGDVYVKNNSSIMWGYHTDRRKDSFAYMPLLVGFEDRDFTPPFKAEFEPNFTVHSIAENIFNGEQNKNDLLETYTNWQRMVFNS